MKANQPTLLAALILLGFASALRRSELADLDLADIEPKPGGLLVHVRKSKGDPERRGQLVGVAPGNNPDTDPIAAFDAWVEVRGHGAGRLFVAVRNEQIGPPAVHRQWLGQDAQGPCRRSRTPGRSDQRPLPACRERHPAAMANVDLARIVAQTRHTRISTLVEHYIRPLEALRVTSSRDLGL